MSASDPRLDQLLGETLQLLAESGVTASSQAVAIGRFASQYHARMEKVLSAMAEPAPTDLQQLIDAAVSKAVATTVQATVESMLSLHQTDSNDGRRKVAVRVHGKRTSVSVPFELFNRMESLLGSKGVAQLAQSFVGTCPKGTVLSRWVAQNLENHLLLQSLGSTVENRLTAH